MQCLLHALLVLEVGRWPGQLLEEGQLALHAPALEEPAHLLVTHAQVACDARRTPAFGGKQDHLHPVPLVSIHIRRAADAPQPLTHRLVHPQRSYAEGGPHPCPGAQTPASVIVCWRLESTFTGWMAITRMNTESSSGSNLWRISVHMSIRATSGP